MHETGTGGGGPAAIPHWMEIDEHLALGAQPDADAVRTLARDGCTLVVNLNAPGARNYWEGEASAVAETGMHYVHYPLDCSSLSGEKYEILRGILMAHRRGKVFLHCAMNVKSSAMAHVFRVRELGHDPRLSREEIARATPGHEPKWERFWSEMGAV
jgi:protein tyrosine phosphatase (PTP) superfamily phosphohydrolase (DUF442 family)